MVGWGRRCKLVEAVIEDVSLVTLYELEVAVMVAVTVVNGKILAEKQVEDVILLKVMTLK